MIDRSGFSLLEWDSNFFERRIARVAESEFSARSVQRLLGGARDEAIECLYLLVDARDSGKVQAAEEAGFRLVDVRVTREREAPGEEDRNLPANIDLGRAEDIPHLRAIAKKSHTDSRFYQDPEFPTQRCDALYEIWIENACNGSSAGVVVARPKSRAVGYVTCEIQEPGLGGLGLVAVAADEAGRGYGGGMIKGAMGWLADKGCTRIRVVTQARNINATRLYETNGFRTISVENSYHLWLGKESTD
ncbi:MAG TPA: GNAT family N-acetyltransferase [Myxococcales bacterium]|nr:GNAT family N-acetyltransferase [Myxococcales bacterium]HIL80450.1 GNAT family N-acetyltransferase [Myxococcales bacterium]